MKLLGRNRGLTLIETMFTATIVAFVTLAVVNLLSRVYQGITSAQLMTTAYEFVSDGIDKLRTKGFANLTPNPANLYTYPSIKAGGASDYFESTTVGNTTFEIYKIVQYAEENANGDLQGLPPCDSCGTNIKMITVHVQYLDRSSNQVKSTERVAYVSNREVPSEGSSIAGTLTAASGAALTVASNPMVYVTGHPELTTSGYTSGTAVMYKIKNLQPGKYSLWAEASGYVPTTYTSNPVNISNTVQAVTGINIALAPADTGMLTGWAYFERLIPQLAAPFTPASVTLMATGKINGGVPVNKLWTHSVTPTGDAQMGTAIGNTNDAKVAITTDHTSANVLTTEFTDTNQTDRPYVVEFNVSYTAQGVGGTDKLRVYFRRSVSDSPPWYSCLWNIQPNPWPVTNTTDVDTTLPNNYYTDIPLANNSNLVTLDITTLFNEGSVTQGWTQTQVNSLSVTLTAIGTNFTNLSIDGIYLNLHYPDLDRPVVNTNISANDGLSSSTMTDSYGRYTLLWNIKTGPGAATNTITAYAIKSVGLTTYDCTRQNLIEAKGQTKCVNFVIIPKTNGICTIAGKVVDISTNLLIPGANITFTLDSNGATFTSTSDGNGNINPFTAPCVSGQLTAAKANYVQTSNSSFTAGSPPQNIAMKPTGKISGRVTNNTTSAGIDGIQVLAKNSSGGSDAVGYTSGGGYYTVTVTAAGTDTYSVECVLDGTQYRTVSPATEGGKLININIGVGTTATNKDFKLDFKMQPISGSASISNPTGTDTVITNGAIVIAQPVGNTVLAQGDSGGYFSSLNDGDEQNTYYRTVCPSFSAPVKQDGTFSVMVPVYGGNYDVYAYYTYTSINANVIVSQNVTPPRYQKIRTNYYKKISAQAPGSSSVNFTGAWTVYP